MMYCGKCGTKNSENNLFCKKCGAKLETVENTNNNLKIEKKSSKVKIFVMITVLICFIGIISVIIILNLGQNEKKQSLELKEEQELKESIKGEIALDKYVIYSVDGKLKYLNANEKEPVTIDEYNPKYREFFLFGDIGSKVSKNGELLLYTLSEGYASNKTLYLFDVKNNKESKYIGSNVLYYKFSKNDNYIVYTEKEENKLNLYVYDYKENIKIDSSISEVIDVTEDSVLYIKNKDLYLKELSLREENSGRIATNCINAILNEKYDKVLYIKKSEKESKNFDYYVYDMELGIDEKVLENVSYITSYSENFDEFFYDVRQGDFSDLLEDYHDIYYKNKNVNEKIISNVNYVLVSDVNKKINLYFTKERNKSYDVFFQFGKDSPIKIANSETLPRGKILENYILLESKFNGNFGYTAIKIENNKLDKENQITSTREIALYKDGIVYLDIYDDTSEKVIGDLKFLQNGKVTTIQSSVSNFFVKENKLYYFTNEGDFYIFDESSKNLLKDIYYIVLYCSDKNMYVFKESSNSEYLDLYKYDGKNLELIDKDIMVISLSKNFLEDLGIDWEL